ncbi:MAG: hypothetical protein ACRBCL_03600 [Maritimibacter sp.]
MSLFDRFFGRGAHSITVPALDGAFRPNEALDGADILVEAPGCTSLAVIGGAPVYSAGTDLFRLGTGKPACGFEEEIAFLAPLPGGGGVCGLVNGDLHRITDDLEATLISVGALPCPTAATALDDNRLIVTSGSSVNGAQAWQRDLLEKRSTGAIYEVDLSTGVAKPIAKGLAWPAGVAVQNDKLVISEAWAARLVTMPISGGAVQEVLGNLPGYPGQLSASENGLWLAVFAPRSQLLEFVLRETAYRETMMREIDEAYWIAPSLRSGTGFLEPLQAGGVRQLGVLKPWAPMRSFGLAVALDGAFIPQTSFHSRADGACHGVTSVIEHDGQAIFAAKGDGKIGAVALGESKK